MFQNIPRSTSTPIAGGGDPSHSLHSTQHGFGCG